MRRFTVVLSVLEGLFMLFDGTLALVRGTYLAPGGQIGPWALVVSAVGIAPLSSGMKTAFVVLGATYIVSAAAYAFYRPRSTFYLGAVAVLTLWYLPLGTILSLVVLVSIAVDASRARRMRA
jgi:hypothetical protein